MTDVPSQTSTFLVDAFGSDKYKKALSVSKGWLLRSVFSQISSGDPQKLASLDGEEVRQVEDALAVAELTALERMDEAEANRHSDAAHEFRSSCANAFYLLRALPKSPDPDRHRKITLKLACFAVLGDRSADIRRWLREQGLPENAPEDAPWPVNVFSSVTDAFLRVVRKNGWQDLHYVARAIANLRDLQATFEKDYLNSVRDSGHVAALELVSLYHLAKAVEILGSYCGKGQPKDVLSELKFHFFRAIRAASSGGLLELDVLLRWLRAASLRIAQNSVWWLLRSFNAKISEHVKNLASEHIENPLLELLPPQRRAILDDGLLDPAHRAVVVQMPTSSGKTLLAEFRILQARNSFPECWIAYLVPTRALVNQIAHRLRRDLGALGIKIETAAPALEVDVFEEEWLRSDSDADIIVTTPEKLDLLVRGSKRDSTRRPLGLVILDEAHNLAEGERGVRAELLLATLNQECPDAQFLLLTPFVPNGDELATWLDNERSKCIRILAADWQPNDRAIGIVYPEGSRRDWKLCFKTLHTMPASVEIEETLSLEGPTPPLNLSMYQVKGAKSRVAAAAARLLSRRPGSSCIVLADSPSTTWTIADLIYEVLPEKEDPSGRIGLVQRFLETEFSSEFRLVELLRRGIAVHHGGLSPEARFLIEWLTEEGDIQVLVATTTLAQGVNFPVSSVVLATHYLYHPDAGKQEMTPAAFQNLAGRAGRLFQDTLGIVAFASQDEKAPKIQQFVSRQVGELASALEEMVLDVLDRGWELNLTSLVRNDTRWASFAQYLAHAYRQAGNHERFLVDTEKVLRATWGYLRLAESEPAAAEQLVFATREYAETLGRMGPRVLSLVDSTGFSGETIMEILQDPSRLPSGPSEWSPSKLFAGSPESLRSLFEILIGVRELRLQTARGTERRRLADLLSDWVKGESFANIAKSYYQEEGQDLTSALTKCCQEIFRDLSRDSAWGIGALQTVSNIDISKLSEEEAEAVRTIPAMFYYGVSTVYGVLMRSLSVPRSIAVTLGERFKKEDRGGKEPRVYRARKWLENQPVEVWELARPSQATLSGEDYRRLWRVLNGMVA